MAIEFIGGVGVMITLVYLAIQIRRNTQEVRDSTTQALLASSWQLFGELLNSQVPEIVEKMEAGKELSVADRFRLRLVLRRNLQEFEMVYLQYQQGRIPDEVMQAYERRLESEFSQFYWRYWPRAKRACVDSFVRYVEQLEQRSSTPVA